MVLRIHALPTDLANQIAAGEVIERPASVVKELLENARDAEARTIHIEVEFGGLNRISVSDNGQGIHSDDLPLAIMAHATSKIKTLNDLYAIHTMGFRGEALASIASVARLIIQSKTEQAEQASQLSWHHNRWHVSPCARQTGTTIEVRDLFYNAPVRKRFLKSERTEYHAVESVVRRFALSTPEAAIVLSHNGKVTLDLPAAKDQKRVLLRLEKLFGKPFMQSATYIDNQRAGMTLRGWISDETYQRSQSDKQWIYVNERMVKDKLLNHAIKQAYESIIYPGRHPACLLYLTIDPGEVDVNVHPTKHELRFQQPRLVHDFIVSQISEKLGIDQSSESNPSQVAYSTQAYTTGNSRWQLTESSQSPTLPKTQNDFISHNLSMQSLSPEYGIMQWQNQWLLWHKPVVAKQAYIWHLDQQPRPLLSRPLLVPVEQLLSEEQIEAINPYLLLFQKVGIAVRIVNNKLQWTNTPIALPQLPLQELIELVLKNKPGDDHQLIALLVMAHLTQSSLDDATTQDLLMVFCDAHHKAIDNDQIEGIIRLTDHHCRSILYG